MNLFLFILMILVSLYNIISGISSILRQGKKCSRMEKTVNSMAVNYNDGAFQPVGFYLRRTLML